MSGAGFGGDAVVGADDRIDEGRRSRAPRASAPWGRGRRSSRRRRGGRRRAAARAAPRGPSRVARAPTGSGACHARRAPRRPASRSRPCVDAGGRRSGPGAAPSGSRPAARRPPRARRRVVAEHREQRSSRRSRPVAVPGRRRGPGPPAPHRVELDEGPVLVEDDEVDAARRSVTPGSSLQHRLRGGQRVGLDRDGAASLAEDEARLGRERHGHRGSRPAGSARCGSLNVSSVRSAARRRPPRRQRTRTRTTEPRKLMSSRSPAVGWWRRPRRRLAERDASRGASRA